VVDPLGRDEHALAGMVAFQPFGVAQFAQAGEVVGVAVGDEHRVDHHRAAVAAARERIGHEAGEQLVVAAVDENHFPGTGSQDQPVTLLNVHHRQPQQRGGAQRRPGPDETLDGAPAGPRDLDPPLLVLITRLQPGTPIAPVVLQRVATSRRTSTMSSSK
jgi:hypothetical protein